MRSDIFELFEVQYLKLYDYEGPGMGDRVGTSEIRSRCIQQQAMLRSPRLLIHTLEASKSEAIVASSTTRTVGHIELWVQVISDVIRQVICVGIAPEVH